MGKWVPAEWPTGGTLFRGSAGGISEFACFRQSGVGLGQAIFSTVAQRLAELQMHQVESRGTRVNSIDKPYVQLGGATGQDVFMSVRILERDCTTHDLSFSIRSRRVVHYTRKVGMYIALHQKPMTGNKGCI